jgi:hypothetical protein
MQSGMVKQGGVSASNYDKFASEGRKAFSTAPADILSLLFISFFILERAFSISLSLYTLLSIYSVSMIFCSAFSLFGFCLTRIFLSFWKFEFSFHFTCITSNLND